ncbi:MAG: hypothetical protein HKN20_16790, partial [Gemmatimonadetes bacterium]|nr:hypothetical protein [Gemmatimonadota bacterium]
MHRFPIFRFFLIAAIILLLIPPVVFAIVALSKGMAAGAIPGLIVEQYQARRQNLFVCGAISVAPLLALLVVGWIYARFRGAAQTRHLMMWGGLIPIVLVQIRVNFDFWPAFLPSRVYPGFPHGLEFIIGPGVFAPIGMLLGV